MRKYLQFSITRSQILMRIPAEQSKMFSILAEEEISIKRALYDRLKVYIEEFLNKRFDVFLAENRTEIVGAVFVL